MNVINITTCPKCGLAHLLPLNRLRVNGDKLSIECPTTQVVFDIECAVRSTLSSRQLLSVPLAPKINSSAAYHRMPNPIGV